MQRQQQRTVLVILAIVTVLLFILLGALAPTVGGVTMRQAELSKPMDLLLPAERCPLFCWLSIDCVFAVIYTAFFAWALRWLAVDARVSWLSTLGRGLARVVIFAVLFDLAENLILWVSALVGAHLISPWLPTLIKLKWLSPILFVTYLILWLLRRHLPPMNKAASATASGSVSP
jgi:hypothetical protein